MDKAMDLKDQIAKMATIKKLPIATIKLIAAGEVITKPVNVVKELLENSIDAGATSIRIVTVGGGIKLIEISDNGHGIARKNAQLLCRRHTTSKLSTAHDLNRISTFGFRGEALASISEMATVFVKTCNPTVDQEGWQADYESGDLVHEPQNTVQKKQGTQIKVVNLFSNLKQRRVSVKMNNTEEKKAIFDLVMRYAIHHSDRITMSLKEDTKCPDMLCLLAPMNIKSCLGMFYGVDAEENMIDVNLNPNSEEQSMFEGLAHITYKKSTGAHCHSVFILFINNRLIECTELKKEVEALTAEFVNQKQHMTIIYMTLKIPPADIDVNVHPAKTTVTLHYQEEITLTILKALRAKLQHSIRSQVLPLSSQKTISQLTFQQPMGSQVSHPIKLDRLQLLTQPLSQSVNTVRDSPYRQYLPPQQPSSPILVNDKPPQEQQQQRTPQVKRQYDLIHNDSSQISIKRAFTLPLPVHKEPRSSPKARKVNLKSIHQLRQQVGLDRANLERTNLIKNSIFVGLFDHDRALIQYETSLYCINLKAYLKEQYYQFYLYDFGNFPPIDILAPGNQIKYFIDAHLKDVQIHEQSTFRKLKYNSYDLVIEELLKHGDMLEDYLTVKLTRGCILTLPCIIPDEIPNLIYLGRFLVELANNVDYSEERECLRQIGRLVADFYSEPPMNLRDKSVHRAYHEKIKTKLYEAIKKYLIVPEWLFTKENICKISDIKDLFKVFERC